MYNIDKTFLKDTFIKLAKIDSQSCEANADQTPSSDVQHNFAKKLSELMKNLGVQEVTVDKHAYVSGKIKANIKDKTPIAFISHIDTAPASPATGIKPIIHENYRGGDIKLPKDGQIITTEDFPELKDKVGDTIITSDGSTLLSGDDKAGIAAVLAMAKYLLVNPEVKHGDIYFFFAPDEEIGHGASLLDIDKYGVHHGYTVDGPGIGILSIETFSADFMELEFIGREIHPGDAKGRMINALRVAASFMEKLPLNLRPETTSGKEGFVHPLKIEGETASVKISIIIRDFNTDKLKDYEAIVDKAAKDATAEYSGSSYKTTIKEQYRNMKYKLEEDRRIIDFAAQAFKDVGIEPTYGEVRGGTDGSQLSYRGLLSPDIAVGYYGMHSKTEWLSMSDLTKATEIITRITEVWANS